MELELTRCMAVTRDKYGNVRLKAYGGELSRNKLEYINHLKLLVNSFLVNFFKVELVSTW